MLDGVHLDDDDVLGLIAERVTDNIRALEGALIRIVAHHSLTARPIDVALATEVLDGMYPRPHSASLSITDIQASVAGYYQLSVPELVSSSRAARISWPRQVAIHLTRELTNHSLHTIGDAFGRNHATVLHACKRVSERMTREP